MKAPWKVVIIDPDNVQARERMKNLGTESADQRAQDSKGWAMKLSLYVELAVVTSLIVVLGLATYQRNLVWKDHFSLWSDVVDKSAYEARPHLAFGTSLMEKGLYDQSISEFVHIHRFLKRGSKENPFNSGTFIREAGPA